MTTLDLSPVPRRGRIGWSLADAWVMCKRNLVQIPRTPELLVFSTIQPVMFVLLFVYVFGGSIDTGPIPYRDYLMPGIFVQTVVFGAMTTGIGLAEDLQKGLVDRFRTLPMSRGALLAGRTLADLVRNLFIVVVMLAVGLAVGFRFHGTTVIAALTGFAVLLLFAYSFSWISATIGLSVRSAEAAQSGGFVWVFPLTFASSAFVPVANMPGWLQVFAKHQPVTQSVNAVRALLIGGPVTSATLQSVAWSLGLLAVFVPLSVRCYRRAAVR
jgi:ABC-2 type transport system permease protein/oleandomycin transport system permease protein